MGNTSPLADLPGERRMAGLALRPEPVREALPSPARAPQGARPRVALVLGLLGALLALSALMALAAETPPPATARPLATPPKTAATPEGLPPAATVRNSVSTILSQPEYHAPPPSAMDIFWQRVADLVGKLIQWLLRPIGWLVDKLGKMGVGSQVAYWMVAGLLIVILLLILFHIYHASASAFGRRGRKPLSSDGALPPVHDSEDLLALARRAEARGDYREAVRLIYQAALLRLDRLGVFRYEPTKTNWAYATEVASSGPMGVLFGHLTRVADRALYSPAPVTAEHYSQADRFYGELQEALT